MSIKNISINWNTFNRQAKGSDNFPMSIRSTNPLEHITSFGDGWGFNEKGSKRSLGFSILKGDSPGTGVDIAGSGGKCYGVQHHALNNTFLAFVGVGGNNSTEDAFRDTQLWELNYSGEILQKTSIIKFSNTHKNLVLPTFLQDSTLEGEHYYCYCANINQLKWYKLFKDVFCFRISKHNPFNTSYWEYWNGSEWNIDKKQLKPIIGVPEARTIGACVVPYFNKILLITEHTKDSAGNIAIYQADEPQGPFGTLKRYSAFGREVTSRQNFFTGYFAPGWFNKISDDTVEGTLVLSGAGENDAMCSVKINIIGEFEEEPPEPKKEMTVRDAIKTFYIDNDIDTLIFVLLILNLIIEEIDTNRLYNNVERTLPNIEHCEWMDDKLPDDVEMALIGLDLILKSGKTGKELEDEIDKLLEKFKDKLNVDDKLEELLKDIEC